MAPEHEKKDKRRGPIRKADKLELPEEKQAESAVAESTGAGEVEQPQSEAPSSDAAGGGTAPSAPEPAPPAGDTEETPAMKQLREKHEAKAEGEDDKGPHPYTFQVNNAPAVPMGLRDPMTGNPSRDLIEEHLQYCWNIGATPIIEGVMVGERVK